MPVDLTDVVMGAVEEAAPPTEEQTEVAAEVESAGTTDASTTEAEKTPPVETKPPDVNEEDELKKLEDDFLGKNPTAVRGRISVSRHQAVVTRTRNRAAEEKAELERQIKALTDKSNDPDVKRRLDMIQLAETDADRFYGALKAANPRYAALIQADAEALAKKIATSTTPEVKPGVVTSQDLAAGAPEPDVLLADGRATYSPEQLLKVLEWQAGSLTKKFGGELDKVRGEVKPLVEEKRHAAELGQAMTRMETKIAQAKKDWPGFADHAKAIGEMIGRPENVKRGMSLEEAYIAVVPSQFVQTQDKIRADAEAKAVKDLQQRVPKETVRPGAVAVVKAGDKETPMDLEAIIKSSIKHVA